MPFVVPNQNPQFGAQPPALPDGVRQNLQPQQQPMVEARPAVPYPQARRPYNPMARRQMPQYGIPQDQSRRGYGIDMSFMNRPTMPGAYNVGQPPQFGAQPPSLPDGVRQNLQPQRPQGYDEQPMRPEVMPQPYSGYGRGQQRSPRMSFGRNY